MRMLFFLSFFLPSLCLSSSQPETLTAVLICDTNSNLRATVKSDQEHMLEALKMIAQKTKMRLVTHSLTGKRVTARKVEQYTDILAKSNGVTLFYFTGHGIRMTGSQSPWPHLVLIKRYEQLSGHVICNKLRQGRARLTLVIFDCCNQTFPEKVFSPLLITKSGISGRDPSCAALERLFVKSRGTIVMAAATPGEVARGTTMGSFFTSFLLESLSTRKGPASWQDIFSQTKQKCYVSNQHPIWEFSLAPLE